VHLNSRLSQNVPFMCNHMRSTVNDFMNCLHSGAGMHCSSRYVGPRDGAVSDLLSPQQEAVVCILRKVTVVKGSYVREAEIENVAV
jgi:hypothetical protein